MIGAAVLLALTACGLIEEPPPSDEISMPPWAESGPTASDYLRVYPLDARRNGLESVVYLDCTIRNDRKLDCRPQRKEDPDNGFGVAAMAVSNLFVVKRSDDPNIQPGKQVVLPIVFRLVE
jgi:hypothetical protein